MEDRNTKGTLHAKPWGFRVELVVDFFIDYGGVENIGRLNDVCWRHLDVCMLILCCNDGVGGVECEERYSSCR